MNKHTTTAGLTTALLVALGLTACGYPGDDEDRAAAAGGSEEQEQDSQEQEDTSDDASDDDQDSGTDGEDGSEDADEGSEDDEDGGLIDMPTVELIPDDLDEDEATVYLAAEQAWSPTIARYIVHSGDAGGNLAGTDIEIQRFDCLGQAQLHSTGTILEGSGDGVYDIQWHGENPEPGSGGFDQQFSVTINDQMLVGSGIDAAPDLVDHEAALDEFGGMCGDLADFVLP